MWVIYRKKDQQIVGMSAHSQRELDKKFALEEVVRGLVKSGSPDDFEAIQVTDHGQAMAIIFTQPERLALE